MSFLESEFQLPFFFCISHICTKSTCSINVVSISLKTLYKFSKLRPLNYWNSGKSRYTPYPVSIFASQHKNNLDFITHLIVELYSKVTGVEPYTKVIGQKSPELTEPHSNSYHELLDLN